MTMIWFYLAAFSSLLTVLIWLRDEWIIIREAKKHYRILYPIFFIALSVIAIRQYHQIDEMSKMEKEAKIISDDWPRMDAIQFLSKGERLGIIMSGQTFLEKHKDKFPDTYKDFQELKRGRLGNYQSKKESSESLKEFDDLEDVCGATITIIKNLTKK